MLPDKCLKQSLLISGLFLLISDIGYFIFSLYLMKLNQGNDDPYGLGQILVTIFWVFCIFLTILASCVIAGVQNKSQILLNCFNVGSIIIFLVNLAIIFFNTEFYLFQIMQIIFAFSMGLIIILSCCYIYHPNNQIQFEKDRINLDDDTQN